MEIDFRLRVAPFPFLPWRIFELSFLTVSFLRRCFETKNWFILFSVFSWENRKACLQKLFDSSNNKCEISRDLFSQRKSICANWSAFPLSKPPNLPRPSLRNWSCSRPRKLENRTDPRTEGVLEYNMHMHGDVWGGRNQTTLRHRGLMGHYFEIKWARSC